MARRGDKRTRRGGTNPADVAAFTGSLRNLDESTGIDVTFSLLDDDVVVGVEGDELGRWPLDDITLWPLDAKSYDFAAAGDHLIFTPDDVVAFRESPILVRGDKTRRQKKRSAKRRAKTTASKEAPSTDAAPAVPRKRKGKKSKPKRAKDVNAAIDVPKAKKPKPKVPDAEDTSDVSTPTKVHEVAIADRDPSPADESALAPEPALDFDHAQASERLDQGGRSAVAVVTEDGGLDAAPNDDVVQPRGIVDERADVAPSPDAVIDREVEETVDTEEQTEKPAPATVTELASIAPKQVKKRRGGPWVRLVDVARRRDLFGLNRVQIDEAQRGSEHQHTWDHRLATGEGVSNHVCTICGKVRIRTG